MKSLLHLGITVSLIAMAPYCHAFAVQSIHPGPHRHFTHSAQQKLDSLQRYVGTYELAPGQQLTISLGADTLYIIPPNETVKAALKPVGPNEFAVAGEEARVVFKPDPTGQITAVELRFGNGDSAIGKKR